MSADKKEKRTTIKTEVRKKQILDMLASGKTVRVIKDYLINEIGLSKFTARDLINEVISDVISDEYKEILKASSILKLDEIISDSINDGDRKSALKGIDILNKATGAYTEKIEISGEEDITLNFNL